MILLIRNHAVLNIRQLIKISPTLVFGLGGSHADVEVALEHLVPVEVLYHYIEVVFVFLKRFWGMTFVGVFENTTMPTHVTITLAFTQRWHALGVFTQDAAVAVIYLISLLII